MTGITIARIAHILAAIIWVGGTAFLVTVGVPYARSLDPEQRVRALSELGKRFRPWGWASLALLVVSGLYMMLRLHVASWDTLTGTSYGRLLLTKIALVAVVIVLTAVHGLVLGPRAASGQASPSAVRAVARSGAILSIVIPIVGILLAH